MVGAVSQLSSVFAVVALWLPLAEEQTLLVRLDPVSRAKVLMALLGLILLGAVLVTIVWLSGRYLRRIARRPYRPLSRREDAWFRKPLVQGQSEPPETSDPQ